MTLCVINNELWQVGMADGRKLYSFILLWDSKKGQAITSAFETGIRHMLSS